jgi:hypothetical protein
VVLLDKPGGAYWETWQAFLGEYLLKLGLVSAEDFYLFRIVADVDAAVEEVLGFYRIFRSYRWVGQRLVIRIARRLTPAGLEKLNADFFGVCVNCQIEQTPALPEELDEPELAELPRLVLTPNRRNFGILRRLLDAINRSETE